MVKKKRTFKIRRPFIVTVVMLGLAFWAQESIQNKQNFHKKNNVVFFPKIFGEWTGSDLQLGADIIQMLDPDQLLFRRYHGPYANDIEIYGVFYESQGANRTMHSPLNCYPGSGWEVVKKNKVLISNASSDEAPWAVTRLILQKGVNKRLLYYWYYAAGKLVSNQYMNKFLTLYSALFRGRTDGGLMTVSAQKDEQGIQQRYMENVFMPELLDYLSKQPISY